MKKNSGDIGIANLNRVIARVVNDFKPPEDLTVSQWSDKYRIVSREAAAEAGRWRTIRTPYLKDPMDAFTDPLIEQITIVAASQVGKSETQLNIIGYIIDQDPGSILYVQPSLEDGKKFAKLRVAPMIRDTRRLRRKVAPERAKDSSNTIMQKSFPGGMLTITGSNSASALSSTPVRYVIGDELDRWARSAGNEGDPWELAKARQRNFYNAKRVAVSTCTIKGSSKIEAEYAAGTQERWNHQCPHCGEWSEIVFNDIKYEFDVEKVGGAAQYTITEGPHWMCPQCAALSDEATMRQQPQKYIALNPKAYAQGHRSFWVSAFISPWVPWEKIVTEFLDAHKDPERLQVIYNTLLGQLWEDRGEIEDEDTLLKRREEYSAELPDGVLVLTCGVDTQGDRLEYEVVGYGLYGESWGIKKGVILGRPDTPEVWQRLDDVVDHNYAYADGRKLMISMTCVDSGGHYTQEVYRECMMRQNKRVFAIKGKGGEGVPFTQPPKKAKITIRNKYIGSCWLYSLGVDAGKASIMASLKVQEEGPKYCHFPANEECGYDMAFFNGLLSEKMVRDNSGKYQWKKLPGHDRNEALDCRNYANAAFKILDPDMDAVARRAKGQPAQPRPAGRPRKKRDRLDFNDW